MIGCKWTLGESTRPIPGGTLDSLDSGYYFSTSVTAQRTQFLIFEPSQTFSEFLTNFWQFELHEIGDKDTHLIRHAHLPDRVSLPTEFLASVSFDVCSSMPGITKMTDYYHYSGGSHSYAQPDYYHPSCENMGYDYEQGYEYEGHSYHVHYPAPSHAPSRCELDSGYSFCGSYEPGGYCANFTAYYCWYW